MANLKAVKRVLITGGTGLLGVAIQQSAPTDIQGFSIYFPERSLPIALPFPILAADVTDMMQMQSVFEWAKPDVVIHTAAIGSVDFAERNREETRKVNVGGTEVVAALCQIFKSRLIYISSNAVFDGRTPFYSETAPVNPINYYGQLKVEAENIVRESSIPWAIVRPILMYGWPYPGERDNPVVWWVRSLEDGKPIKVVDNVFTKPLLAWSCAESVWEVIRQHRTGIYHVAGRDHLSLYQFALKVAEVFDLDTKLITPVPDSYFPGLAPRPRDTSFDTLKMENELGLKTIGVKVGLVHMKSERSVIRATHQ
ncbi:MAG: SDR family oxidoreductase [Deltaproteobacteria bacterium]|nr:SDR family oxidoreductase [Deltaproteobacteria bacterium]